MVLADALLPESIRQESLDHLVIRVANATFPFGWEYLGVPDRFVQTPLTDRVYLTPTQALHGQFGGSPFGPADTGIFVRPT